MPVESSSQNSKTRDQVVNPVILATAKGIAWLFIAKTRPNKECLALQNSTFPRKGNYLYRGVITYKKFSYYCYSLSWLSSNLAECVLHPLAEMDYSGLIGLTSRMLSVAYLYSMSVRRVATSLYL